LRDLAELDASRPDVQLARLSLWLCTLAADRPLTFLDHHLRAGNTLAGARDHLVLPVSHTGMLFSVEVAHQVGQFLAQGRFDRTPQSTTIPPRD